jgi:S-adenosylmethionine synthetase
MKRLITTECVGFGHPDFIADQISDALVDLYVSKDPKAKCGIETMVKDNHVVVGGEVKCRVAVSKEEVNEVILNVVKTFNFSKENGFNLEQIQITNLIGEQSPEINGAVDNGEFIGAGDQGYQIAMATNETSNYMPLGCYISKKLTDYVVTIDGFGPDCKSQVTIEEDGNKKRIHTIIISTMHRPDITVDVVRKKLLNDVLTNEINLEIDIARLIDKDTKIIINSGGSWNIGGPTSDSGITGRKLAVNFYGPYAPIGGGSLASKCGYKTDRSGAYAARYIAKNIVAAGLASKAKVELAYAIGVAEPIAINIDTFNTGKISDEDLVDIVYKVFPLTPSQIIQHFGLDRPIFYNTSRYGHFGFEGNSDRLWEMTDKVEELQKYKLTLVEEL